MLECGCRMLEATISYNYKSEIAHPTSEILPTFTKWQKQKQYFSVRVVEPSPRNGWGDALRAESGTLLWKKWFNAMSLLLKPQAILKLLNRVL